MSEPSSQTLGGAWRPPRARLLPVLHKPRKGINKQRPPSIQKKDPPDQTGSHPLKQHSRPTKTKSICNITKQHLQRRLPLTPSQQRETGQPCQSEPRIKPRPATP